MDLYEFVTSSLKDEKDATSEYDEMLNLVSKDETLSDSEKSLISGSLFSIKEDERQHNVLLQIIKDVLDNKKKETVS